MICRISAGALACLLSIAAVGPVRAETCVASHYGVGDGYGGRRTASGERMNPHAMTAARPSRRDMGKQMTVTNLANGRSVTVRINDIGPNGIRGRCVDLSYGAAKAIGISGVGRVSVQ